MIEPGARGAVVGAAVAGGGVIVAGTGVRGAAVVGGALDVCGTGVGGPAVTVGAVGCAVGLPAVAVADATGTATAVASGCAVAAASGDCGAPLQAAARRTIVSAMKRLTTKHCVSLRLPA